MYCYLLLLLGLLPYLLPSNRLIILYSYHYTYHVLLVITILLLVVGYMRRLRRGRIRTRARPSRLRAIATRKPRDETRPSGGEFEEKQLYDRAL